MTRLTTQELEAIRKRAEKATEGPWRIEQSDYVCNAGFWTIDTLIMPDISSNVYGKNDAEFIANAREDIPALLEEVERLREEITFISNVGGVTNAYDEDSVPISVKSWAERALNGGDA